MQLVDVPAYSIALRASPWLLDFALRGHWDMDTVARYAASIRDVVARLPGLGVRVGEQVTLVDITAFAVQSPEVLVALTGTADPAGLTSRRVALVRNSALLSLQAKRALPHLPLFDTREAALEWLYAEGPQVPA